MYRFFDSTIRPLLDEIAPLSTMIEVGAENGWHTNRLLPYARAHRAHLHVIDPAPRFQVDRYRERFASCSTLHLGLSHDVLPSIEAPDVVFLDGDHNWYTVVEELRILDRSCRQWPVTFVHDIEWPYGRRDMYYAPQRVPEDQRQPYAQSGIVRGRSELSPDGINGQMLNAMHEGGPRNGVLTAVEDFQRETHRDLMLFTVPGNNGLAIVLDRGRMRNRRLAKRLKKVHDPRARAKPSQRRPVGAPA
jgi:methyltransferase family protein